MYGKNLKYENNIVDKENINKIIGNVIDEGCILFIIN